MDLSYDFSVSCLILKLRDYIISFAFRNQSLPLTVNAQHKPGVPDNKCFHFCCEQRKFLLLL